MKPFKQRVNGKATLRLQESLLSLVYVILIKFTGRAKNLPPCSLTPSMWAVLIDGPRGDNISGLQPIHPRSNVTYGISRAL